MVSKTRILVLATTFPRWRNDTEPAFVYELSTRLAKKYDISVLAPHHNRAKTFEKFDGLTVYRFPYFYPFSLQKLCYEGGIFQNLKSRFAVRLLIPFFILSEVFSTFALVGRNKFNLLHAHWVIPQGFIAALIKKIYGVPYIVTAHAGDVFPVKSRFLRVFARFALRNADYCTVNSDYTKNSVTKILPLKNIKIIPMGVDVGVFNKSGKSKAVRKKLSISGKFILSVGRLAEKKGVIYLIMAMPAVLKQYPDAKLVIVGEGSEKDALKKKVLELNIKKSVIFAGNVKNNKLPDYYKSADVFVGPSIITKSGDTEGLGIVFLEALSAGTPAIGSNIGGIPDIIKDKKTGLLVEQKSPVKIADAIIEVLSNKGLAETLAKNGKAHVIKNYSWDNVAKKFSELIESWI